MKSEEFATAMKQRIIAIDQSTSSTKALLFDEECRMLARTNVDHKQYYPQMGWVEHDAEEIYCNTIEAIRQLIEVTIIQLSDAGRYTPGTTIIIIYEEVY